MALRLVEVILPTDQAPALRELLEAGTGADTWRETLDQGQFSARVLLDAKETGPIVDAIDERFGAVTGYQLLIIPVEAALPRPPEPETPADPEPPPESPDRPPGPRDPTAKLFGHGVSREELHTRIRDVAEISPVFLATVVLSTIVAAIGVLRDNIPVVIGAMVIAPLLGPNVAAAFATTVGDMPLLRRALRSNVVGMTLALALTIALGAIVPFDPSTPEIVSRAEAGPSDVVLALAAGSVGALALTTGMSAALVGVMVAVALLPPTVVLGLLLGAAEWELAGHAALLLATNVICINLAGVLTFLVQGVFPRSWWKAERARRSTRVALLIWFVLLVVLVVLLVV